MIYLFGIYKHAISVARRNRLIQGRDWIWLNSPWELIGTEAPNVVYLETARQVMGYSEIMNELDVRAATLWSELDLDNGKVPR